MATKEHANHKAAFSQMKKLGKKAREPNIFISHICALVWQQTKSQHIFPTHYYLFFFCLFVGKNAKLEQSSMRGQMPYTHCKHSANPIDQTSHPELERAIERYNKIGNFSIFSLFFPRTPIYFFLCAILCWGHCDVTNTCALALLSS